MSKERENEQKVFPLAEQDLVPVPAGTLPTSPASVRAAAAPVGSGRIATPPPLPAEVMSTGDLVKEALTEMTALAKKELALAKAELQADFASEIGMVKGLAFAAIGALTVLNTLVMAVVLALAHVVPGWAAALLTAGALSLVVAVVATTAWKRRVKNPLAHTRRALKDDANRLKEWAA